MSQNNNDGEGSSSDESYYAELARIKQRQQEEEKKNQGSGISAPGINAPNRRFVPKLAVKSLGLSTLMQEGQAKTQEELGVERNVQESKGITIPALKKNHTLPDQ